MNLANKAGSVTMTCQVTDTREVTRYEWVHKDVDHSGNLSVASIHKGKEVTVTKLSGDDKGEWTCRFYGKQGILGNVTHHMPVMSTLLFVITHTKLQPHSVKSDSGFFLLPLQAV